MAQKYWHVPIPSRPICPVCKKAVYSRAGSTAVRGEPGGVAPAGEARAAAARGAVGGEMKGPGRRIGGTRHRLDPGAGGLLQSVAPRPGGPPADSIGPCAGTGVITRRMTRRYVNQLTQWRLGRRGLPGRRQAAPGQSPGKPLSAPGAARQDRQRRRPALERDRKPGSACSSRAITCTSGARRRSFRARLQIILTHLEVVDPARRSSPRSSCRRARRTSPS